MKTSRRNFAVACAIVALATLSWWLTKPVQEKEARIASATTPLARPAGRMSSDPAVDMHPEVAKPLLRAGWSRAEAAKYLRAYFLKEQLRAELDLEQARYRGQYWETEPGLAELRQRELHRGETIRRLTAEMNGLLAEACPAEPGEPLALTPFFSLDQPAPNLAFLSGVSREKMEVAMLALAREGSLESGRLLEIAGQTLSGAELADYTHWNAPAPAALRNRLAGFAADENEFAAILQWQSAAGSEDEAGARIELGRRLGPERLAQWEAQNDPAMSTALQDLHRLGRPLDQAAWLADFRRQAATQLQASWASVWLTGAQKQSQVGLLQKAFRDELATQLDLPAADIDLLP